MGTPLRSKAARSEAHTRQPLTEGMVNVLLAGGTAQGAEPWGNNVE